MFFVPDGPRGIVPAAVVLRTWERVGAPGPSRQLGSITSATRSKIMHLAVTPGWQLPAFAPLWVETGDRDPTVVRGRGLEVKSRFTRKYRHYV
jgi:hypothetical protein